jgi:hypothetical protein
MRPYLLWRRVNPTVAAWHARLMGLAAAPIDCLKGRARHATGTKGGTEGGEDERFGVGGEREAEGADRDGVSEEGGAGSGRQVREEAGGGGGVRGR